MSDAQTGAPSIEAILNLFDRAAAEFQFPDLGHVYEYLIDCRLHAFSDATRWSLVVEKVAYNPRGGAIHDIGSRL